MAWATEQSLLDGYAAIIGIENPEHLRKFYKKMRFLNNRSMVSACGVSACGVYHGIKREIIINTEKGMPFDEKFYVPDPKNLLSTFSHELTHAIDYTPKWNRRRHGNTSFWESHVHTTIFHNMGQQYSRFIACRIGDGYAFKYEEGLAYLIQQYVNAKIGNESKLPNFQKEEIEAVEESLLPAIRNKVKESCGL